MQIGICFEYGRGGAGRGQILAESKSMINCAVVFGALYEGLLFVALTTLLFVGTAKRRK
jgi:hypothetical protein